MPPPLPASTAPSGPLLPALRPGPGYAVLGGDVALLLPLGDRARAASLWALVDADVRGPELLDALLAGGLTELPDLALA